MEAGPNLDVPESFGFSVSSARQRLMEQIAGPITCTTLPDLALVCEEQLEEASRQELSPQQSPGPAGKEGEEEMMWEMEVQGVECTDYETLLRRVSPITRAILLDWVCEVCADYGLKRETYHLACSFIGRYLIKCHVAKADLQLLAISSLSLAAKAEEELAPRLAQLAQSCSNAFTAQQIKEMEQRILCGLSWRLYLTTPACTLHSLMVKWDYFLTQQFGCYRQQPEDWVSFTDWTPPARTRLLRAFWVLDAGLLLPQILTFNMLEYTATVLYLSVCYGFQVSNYTLLKAATTLDPASSELTLCRAVDDLFSLFLGKVCGMSVEHLHARIGLLVPFFYRVGDVETEGDETQDDREKRLWATRQRHYGFTLKDVSRILKTS